MADLHEDVKKTKKKVHTKKKNNDPKWKVKKEAKKIASGKTVEKRTTNNKTTKKVIQKAPSSYVNKKEGITVDKEKIIDKYNIENTVVFPIPSREKLQEVSITTEKSTADSPISNIKHFSFLSRVCTLVVIILIFLLMCILFSFKAIGYELGGVTSYSEYTSNDYSVCTKEIGVYDGTCLEKDLNYITDLVTNINATFNYEALYNKEVSYNANYYVSGRLKIYDKKDASRIRYTKEDVFLDSTNLHLVDEVIHFSTNIDIDFASYRKIIQDYISATGVDSGAELEVALYLENSDVTRKISYITIPLTDDSFTITSNNLDNQNQLVINNEKTQLIDSFYAFIAFVCFLMDILLLLYLVNFVYMVNHLDNKYNTELKKILKEYDHIIVNATSEYLIPDDVRVVEVSSFKELLDARRSLEKPIVYERVNNIKSRFYLEDDKTLYIYKMKDEGK